MIWYIQETIKYRMRAIITRDLYILNTLFEGQYVYLRDFFSEFWPCVQLVFKSGF